MKWIQLLRPHHWIKNGFIFMPLFFGGKATEVEMLKAAMLAFGSFSLMTSSIYILNDCIDRNQDALHPTKKNRPIAAGKIKIKHAVILGMGLLVASLFLMVQWIPSILIFAGIYVGLNLLYSFGMKAVPILDIFLISGLYLLRILIGGAATQTPISDWLMLCTIFVALFLIVGKRKAESVHPQKRKVLEAYSPVLLDQLLIIALSLTLITYSLYTILGTEAPYAIYSVFFVCIGLLRYLFKIQNSTDSEYPEKLIFSDKIIAGSIVTWFLYMAWIFY